MGTSVVVVIVVVVVLVLAGAGLLVAAALRRRRRRRELQERFGPEYERRVAELGDRKEAEAELEARADRHAELELRPLSDAERDGFQADWQHVQRGFVDDPGGAVEDADALVVTIMRHRGYPVEDGQQRADDLSVAHPRVVEHYRVARRIAHAHREGRATTEDLRTAVTSFRDLVEALLEDAGHGEGRGDGVGGPESSTRRLRPGEGSPGDGAEARTSRIAAGGPEGSTDRFGGAEGSTDRLGGAERSTDRLGGAEASTSRRTAGEPDARARSTDNEDGRRR